ncbi:portal protein [Bartonella krasnovii]|uniref:portal protein n=1 Tax=Bartonella krasnovii TaxID=2267275 RepID=UPI001F4CDEEF|nr:portal protein [Bartonella krasnovii]UNF47877.1 phage portal protein [Bartonella krasnovii]
MDGILNHNSQRTIDFDEYELYRRLKSWYKEDIEHVNEWREQAREDFDFYNGRQWAEEDLAVLKAQRRPVMTFNRIAPLVNAIVGAERNNKREVQFQPRQVGAAISNELLTGAAEWFRDEAGAEYADSDAFQDMVICGMGWTDTRLDYETNPEGTPSVQRLDPLKMVWDANAARPNLVDAQRLWYVDRKPIEDAKNLFPHVAVEDLHADWAIDGTTACEEYHGSLDAYHEDSKRTSSLESFSGKRYVTLVECRWFEYETYFKAPDLQTGAMRQWSKQEFEQLQRVVPQLQGVSFHKKVVRRAFLGRRLLAKPDKPLAPDGQLGWECITGTLDKLKNQFYGIVRPAKDPQKWSNKYFSQVMYILNSQAKGGLMAERGAFDDERQALENWARTDTITWVKNGALTGGKIQPKPLAQFPQGFFQLFHESREAMTHVTGLSAEFIGTREVNQANVLENTRRQSTLNLLAGLFDNLKLYRCRQGKIILYLIQNHLSDGRLVRISGPENAQYIPLTREAVTTLEYDIIVDDSPTSPNEKEKTFAAMTQMLPLLGGFLTPEMIPDLLKLSPLPATLVANLTAKAQKAQKAQQEQQQQQMMQQSQGTQLTPEKQAKIAALQQESQAKSTLYQLEVQQKQAALQQKNIELFLKQEQARMQLELQRTKNEIEQRALERKAY